MVEDSPAYLSTASRHFCRRNGCAIAGTDRQTGGPSTPAAEPEGRVNSRREAPPKAGAKDQV
jgi:hypothetical protein